MVLLHRIPQQKPYIAMQYNRRICCENSCVQARKLSLTQILILYINGLIEHQIRRQAARHVAHSLQQRRKTKRAPEGAL
jgi:hypothetical protein